MLEAWGEMEPHCCYILGWLYHTVVSCCTVVTSLLLPALLLLLAVPHCCYLPEDCYLLSQPIASRLHQKLRLSVSTRHVGSLEKRKMKRQLFKCRAFWLDRVAHNDI